MRLSTLRDVRWLAGVLAVSEGTVRDVLRRGSLPGVRLAGGPWRVRESVVEVALSGLERERAEVRDPAARVLRDVRKDRRSPRRVVPPRPGDGAA